MIIIFYANAIEGDWFLTILWGLKNVRMPQEGK